MSHCISKFSVSHPLGLGSQRVSKNQCCFPKVSNVLLVPVYGKNGGNGKTRITAMAAGDGREGVDQIQRQNRNQPNQPKRRSAQVAPIGLWDRFPTAKTVQQMMDTMDRLMEDPFAFNSYNSSSPIPAENMNGSYSRGRTPWEIKEAAGEYKLRFDMPGMTKQDVKVWVEEKMLVLKAEKSPNKNIAEGGEGQEGEGEEWSPKSYGRYNMRIALPENVDYAKIRAEVKDGVLYINIPKATVSTKVFDISVE